ncbi:leucine-rich repeat domain-containing protein [Paenibacillus cymbidii]|uniref:leucine-rich repeat domain-containing protein n=1 Tax=Paenibacillus cymbidii TaxID=1639034 RepID=UPI001081D43A|nr:leucine-rich repeat domain-containing protein [Paenibacillus cymbidii]
MLHFLILHKRSLTISLLFVMQLCFMNFVHAADEFDKRIIPDPQLEQLIRDTINKPQGALTPMDLEQVRQLKGEKKAIKSIEGLQYATQLAEISLPFNQITDISPIKNLNQLKTINFDSNWIEDIAPIAALSQLTSVSFTANHPLSDLTPLTNLHQIEFLNLSITSIKDLSPLSHLPNLKQLELMQNNFSNLQPLAALQSLEVLAIGSNPNITDLSPLHGLIHLKTLWITEDGISDLSGLAELENLQELYAYSNQIEDISALATMHRLEIVNLDRNHIQDISPLYKLTKLKQISLYENRIPDLALMKLSKQFPRDQAIMILNQKQANFTPPSLPLADQQRFTDVKPDDWFYNDVAWAVKIGMVNGYDDGTFAPSAKITEAEFLKMLISLYAGDLSKQGDLHWYDEYYRFASAHKWDVSGLPEVEQNRVGYSGTLASEKPLIRLEAAMILLNAIGKEVDSPDELIWEMYNRNFSNGKFALTVSGFASIDFLTRAEAVSLLRNFKENNANKELLAVTQTMEANRILSITNIKTAVRELASAYGYEVKQSSLSREVSNDGSIHQLLSVVSNAGPEFYLHIFVFAQSNQITNVSLSMSNGARPFSKELLDGLFLDQPYKNMILQTFDKMPLADDRQQDMTLPYNRSNIRYTSDNFVISLDESDKQPYGSAE